MKKFLLFAAVATLFVACTQEVVVDVTPSIADGAPETLIVDFEGDDTRIQLNEAQKTVWTKDDQVSVFYRSNANQLWKYTGETGERTAVLKCVDTGNATESMKRVVVVYPYNENYYINTETYNVQASLPAVQHYLADSYGLDGNIMISSAEYNQVTLKNVCGWLKLQLTGEGEVVNSITFKGNNGEQVAGELYINSTDATSVLASDMGNIAEDEGENVTGSAGANLSFDDVALTEVTLDCGEGVTLGSEATAFYIALPPQTFEKGFTVDVNCKGYNPMNITTQKVVTIERNHIQPMAEVAFSSEVRTVANNEIWYTATEKIERASWTVDTFGANVVSHEWDATSGEGIITFDSEISIIGDYAFDNCDILKTIDFNKSITSVGRYAFSNCDALSQIVIPGNIESVGYKAFENCTNVSSIIIEAGNTDLWLAYSFDGIPSTTLYVDRDIYGGYNNSPFENAGITTISIGPNMKNINMFVFSNCKNIQGFNVDSSSQLESIGYAAFYNSKITGLHIPNSVTHIDSSAFAMTSGMGWFSSNSSIYGVGMNGELYTVEKSLRTIFRWPDEFGYATGFASSYHYDKIGDWAFSGIDNLKYFDILMYDGNTIEIGDSAFWNCNNLETFEAGYGGKMSISSIGSSVFGYTAIKELNFLDSSFDTINGTFRNCLDLETLYLPGTLLEIGERTFENCSNLVSIFLASIVPPSLSVDAFNVVPNGLTIYVPAESVSIYKTTEVWSDYADYIVGYDFEKGEVVPSEPKPADNEIWYTTTDGSKQGIYCEGEEFASDWRWSVGSYFTHYYDETNSVWVLRFYETEKLSKFPNIDLTLFGRNDKVNSVIMPDCIEEITGLSGQTALRSIELPANLKIIGRDAFKDCTALEGIEIPDCVTSIGEYAFYGCNNIKNLTIPDGVSTIYTSSLPSLNSLTIGANVTSIQRDDDRYYVYSTIYCKPTTPPSGLMGHSGLIYEDVADITTIYVPRGCADSYTQEIDNIFGSHKPTVIEYDF